MIKRLPAVRYRHGSRFLLWLPVDGVLFAHQGFEMGRPGLVKVRQNPNGRLSISGQAVSVICGQVVLW